MKWHVIIFKNNLTLCSHHFTSNKKYLYPHQYYHIFKAHVSRVLRPHKCYHMLKIENFKNFYFFFWTSYRVKLWLTYLSRLVLLLNPLRPSNDKTISFCFSDLLAFTKFNTPSSRNFFLYYSLETSFVFPFLFFLLILFPINLFDLNDWRGRE